ncbi:hypothetical protein ACFSFW_19275 [Fredinandcohnia salidurans]|uniref:Uncharacterized protein n=1 Tax=Fredinandcohnia salidurans TaxID=2595041 RepID=A0ABW4MSY2_9BACI
MRRKKIEKLDQVKECERTNANQLIASHLRRRKNHPSKRRDEIEAQHQLAIYRWKKALEDGHIRYISKRKWYYDYTKF